MAGRLSAVEVTACRKFSGAQGLVGGNPDSRRVLCGVSVRVHDQPSEWRLIAEGTSQAGKRERDETRCQIM